MNEFIIILKGNYSDIDKLLQVMSDLIFFTS